MPLTPARVLRTFRYAVSLDGIDDYIQGVRAFDYRILTLLVVFNPLRHWGDNWIFQWSGFYREFGCPYWAQHNFIRMSFNAETTEAWRNIPSPFKATRVCDWHQVGFGFNHDTKDLKFVLDGEYFHSASYNYTFSERSGPYRISVGTNVIKNFQGYVCQVLVYDRVLQDSEVRQNYENFGDPVSDGLVLSLLAHPDNVRDIDDDGVLEWIDLSGHGNHAKLYGARLVELVKEPARMLSPARVLAPAR